MANSLPPGTFPAWAGHNFASTLHNDTYPAITAAKCNQSGRAVMITGASKGIGRSCAVSFAQAGATSIILAARSPLIDVEAAVKQAAKTAGHPEPQVLRITLDVADATSVAAAVAETEHAVGRLDVLINNAGHLETWRPMADSDFAEWWATWEVNVKGTYLCTRAFLPLMLKGGEKTIVNMNSIGAHLVRPGASAYQASKLAILRLTEFTAAEYAAQGVLAFAINPGAIPTEMTSVMPPDARARMKDTCELAADTLAWLTQEKRQWLSGRYLSANWDMPEIMSREKEIVEGDKLKSRLVI